MGSLIWRFAAFHASGVFTWHQVNSCAGASSLRFPLEAHGSNTNLSKGQTYTNPRPGQYLTHTHSHVTRAVAAMDRCFALIGAHQHGIAVQSMNGENPRVSKTLPAEASISTPKKRLRKGIFPVHWLGGYAMLMSPNKGETAVHGCHCPGCMAVRVCDVLTRPWVGVCVPRFNIIIESWFDYCFFKNYTFHKSTSEFFFFSSFFLRMRSHLVPPGTGARVRYSLGTNVNTPFFQVPALEFGRGADAGRPCTRALKWAPGTRVHVFSLGSKEFYPQSTSSHTNNSLLRSFCKNGVCSVLTEQSRRKTICVPRVWTKHHFVLVPGH